MKQYKFIEAISEAMKYPDGEKVLVSSQNYKYVVHKGALVSSESRIPVTIWDGEMEDSWTLEDAPFEVKVGDKFRHVDGDILEVLKIHKNRVLTGFINGDKLWSWFFNVTDLKNLERVK